MTKDKGSTNNDLYVMVTAVALLAIAASLALSIYSTIRISQLSGVVLRNEAHLCFLMARLFGDPPEGDHRTACHEFREQVYEDWADLE